MAYGVRMLWDGVCSREVADSGWCGEGRKGGRMLGLCTLTSHRVRLGY